MKEQIEIDVSFHEARDAVQHLIGHDAFTTKVNIYRPILRHLCLHKGLNEMQATHEILNSLKHDGSASLVAMAACTEIMSPSQTEPPRH